MQSIKTKSMITLFIISLFFILLLHTNCTLSNVNPVYAAEKTKVGEDKNAKKSKKFDEKEIVEWVYGQKDAPLEIITYISMSCYACRTMYESIIPKIQEDYVQDGLAMLKIRYISTEVTSFEAEILAHCMKISKYQKTKERRDPNKPMDMIFKSAKQWYGKSNNRQLMFDTLSTSGYNRSEMELCLEDKQMTDQVLKSRLYTAKNMQILATPTMIVNGKHYQGLHSYDWVDKTLKEALRNAEVTKK
ncbi:thioredoxin domain-containing protein [Anaplasmataceae bacterium AB001_6]|nr:thioredoxin domain-containing protein [Anaplasmataceae bacterium AB001_6]